MNLETIVQWTNENSGFLSVILFFATLFYGWISGFFSSIIKKPKLKIRFIDKLLFFSTFDTGEKHIDNGKEYEIYKSAFVVYMSIANIGNMVTSIDKIYLSYYKNKRGFFKEKVWLAQWHTLEPFCLQISEDKVLMINSLLRRDNILDFSDRTSLDPGKSILGATYFEQGPAWGNFRPLLNKDLTATIHIKIVDIYGNKFKFKTCLKEKSIDDARVLYEHFGKTGEVMYN